MRKWKMVKLRDVCQFINGDRGVNYPSKKDFVRDGVPFINAGHLHNKTIDFSEMNYISFEKFMQLGSGKVRNGDILYCLRGSLGKQAIVEDVDFGAIASSLVIIRPLSEVAVKYLSYCLESSEILKQQAQANTGSSQPNLSATNVKNYSVPLPPLDEQKRIAKNLDLTSEIVKGYKEQLAELDRLVQSVFYEMFGDPVTNEKGWDKVSLGEACIKITDGKHGGCNFEEASGYYFVGAREIRNGQICYDTAPQITKEHFEESYHRCNLEKGDLVLVNTGATIGKSAIARSDLSEKTLLQKSVALFKTDINVLLPVFLQCCYTLNSEMYRVKNASAQPNLLLSKIKETKIILPPLSLQIRFASIVTEIEAHKEQVKQALTEAENLFNSLMQEYFE